MFKFKFRVSNSGEQPRHWHRHVVTARRNLNRTAGAQANGLSRHRVGGRAGLSGGWRRTVTVTCASENLKPAMLHFKLVLVMYQSLAGPGPFVSSKSSAHAALRHCQAAARS